MEKLERLNEDLETMMKEKRTTNPIVGNVLAIAAKVMNWQRVKTKTLTITQQQTSSVTYLNEF